MSRINPQHPLHMMFADLVHNQVTLHVDSQGLPDVETYLADLLLAFMRTESVFAIRNKAGQPLRTVIEMVAEADVRLNADSFDREREVHKHIGDFILFWSGVYPDHLQKFKLDHGRDLVCDYTRQGRESYHVVSTFDHQPYDAVADTFQKLSDGFESFQFVLRRVAQESHLSVA